MRWIDGVFVSLIVTKAQEFLDGLFPFCGLFGDLLGPAFGCLGCNTGLFLVDHDPSETTNFAYLLFKDSSPPAGFLPAEGGSIWVLCKR